MELEWCTREDIFIKSLPSLQTRIANFILPYEPDHGLNSSRILAEHTGVEHRALGSSSDLPVLPWGCQETAAGKVPWMLLALSLCLGQPAEHGTAQMYKKASSRHIPLHSHAGKDWVAEVPLSIWSPSPPPVEKFPYICHMLVQELSKGNEAFWPLHNLFIYLFPPPPRMVCNTFFWIFWHQTGSPYQACTTEGDLPVFSTWRHIHITDAFLYHFFSVK